MSTEKEAIEAILKKFEEAWNIHDAKNFADFFAEEADFSNVFGNTISGKEKIEEFNAARFATTFKRIHFHTTATTIRFIKPDVASVDIRWEMTGALDPNGHPWPDRRGLMTLIMEYENNAWLITVLHNMDLPVR